MPSYKIWVELALFMRIFRLAIRIGMNEGHVIVVSNDIAEGRQALFHALHDDMVVKRIAQVL